MNINVSILGLYNFNPAIFDGLTLPEGMDKDILIPDLLAECSDFRLLYPDYDFMQKLIGVWSKKEQPIWQAMYDSTIQEYNPIENYDRHEDISRTVEGSSSTTGTSDTTTEEDSSGSTISSRTSFNSGEPREAAREEVDSNTNTGSSTSSDSSSDSTGTETVTTHVHGNIGVTTAAQMLAGFREISDFSPYQFIIDSFKKRFCIQVY